MFNLNKLLFLSLGTHGGRTGKRVLVVGLVLIEEVKAMVEVVELVVIVVVMAVVCSWCQVGGMKSTRIKVGCWLGGGAGEVDGYGVVEVGCCLGGKAS